MIKISLDNIITGVSLLFLAVCGNFIAETLSCNVRKALTNNMYGKNIIIILLIYFALNIAGDNNVIPTKNILLSFLIWILFLIFNKMSMPFTIISVILLISLLLIQNYKSYYESQDEDKYKKIIESLKKISIKIIYTVLLVILIGFILYFKKQYHDYKNNFSFLKFIFGKTNCKSLN